LGFMLALLKIKCVMLSLYLYQFYPYSFNYYLLSMLLKVIFYSISSLKILFHLIFVSIWSSLFALLLFLFIFQFYSPAFSSFNFRIQLGTHSFYCYFLYYFLDLF
jgi:hypothetical protein